MIKNKRIFIVGNPGAGKGLFAKTLAEKLGWQFINTDLELEFRVGQEIDNIVGTEGSKALLEFEHQLLSTLKNKEFIVVNTDASIPLSNKIIDLLSTEFVVYLQVSTAIQIKRTVRNPQPLLPLLATKEFLDKLHHNRDHLYEKMASITINTDDSKLEDHVHIITKQIMFACETNRIPLTKVDKIIFHKILHTPIELTEQQARCLKLLAQGMSSKVIAKELSISYRTVEGVIGKLKDALGCSSSKELINLYLDKP